LRIIPYLHFNPLRAAILGNVLTVDIDPCHICHHRSDMSEATSLHSSFSIRRHAVQQLLRQALDAAPQAVCGLLGGHDHYVEAILTLHGTVKKGDIRDTLQTWQNKGIRPLATYISEAMNSPDETANSKQNTPLPASLLPEAVSLTLPSLPQLIIHTDTKGRIEAVLLAHPSDTQAQTCSLEMQEDGGLYPLGDKG